MYLYIIRHGHPIYGPQEMLTHTGHKQARALSERMIQSGITKIYSSPLRRARETAAPTARALGLPVNIENWTSESLAWSRFTKDTPSGGKTWVWNSSDPGEFTRNNGNGGGDEWYKIDPMQACPTAKEGYDALMAESDEFMARQGYVRDGNEYKIVKPSEERIAVFCHHGFGVTWLSHLLRIPPTIFWTHFDITHSGVTVLYFANRECGRTIPQCLCFSDMSHLWNNGGCDYLYHSYLKI